MHEKKTESPIMFNYWMVDFFLNMSNVGGNCTLSIMKLNLL